MDASAGVQRPRHVEVRLGKSFLKHFGSKQVAERFPDAPSYSTFVYSFKPAFVDSESTGNLEEKSKHKVRITYNCPSASTVCVFSGVYRPADDMECLLVYDEAEKCYMLEKLDFAYEGLQVKNTSTMEPSQASPAPDSDLVLPPTTTTTGNSPVTVQEVPQAPAKKRARKPRAKPAAAAAATTEAPNGETPVKKPRKKRITKKEREAMEREAAAAAAAAKNDTAMTGGLTGIVEREDSSAAFLRELEKATEEQEQQNDLVPPSIPISTTIKRPVDDPQVMQYLRQDDSAELVPPKRYEVNEEGFRYVAESSSSSDSSSSDSSSSDDDDDDDDD